MSTPAEDDAKAIFINPFYAITFADYLFKDQKVEIAKEDWVLENSRLVGEMGSSDWLEQLLVSLTTEPLDNPTYTVICPRKAVILSTRLLGEHESMIATDLWLAANVKLMKEIGAEEWLWQLLKVLETGGPEPA